MKPIFFLLITLFLIASPALASLPDADRIDDLGERAAITAMDLLKFESGDQNVLVLTNAGRARIDGQTTERAISGITRISGLQNGDKTLYQVNRAEWKPLWFYFFDKESGKGVYLEPAESFYTQSEDAIKKLSPEETFEKAVLVTGDIDQMLADSAAANETQKELGPNAFSLVSISNAWAHGAPYDLLSAVMLHNHFCPGVSSGYMMAKYTEKELPITNSTSYIVFGSPTACKEDIFPILWDLTPGKGGEYIWPLSDNVTAALKESLGSSPKGIIVRWDAKEKTGTALVLGSVASNSTPFEGPEWLAKPVRTVEMVENLRNPENYVSTIKTITIDAKQLEQMKNPVNNPYEVLGLLNETSISTVTVEN